jgi:MFS family permease
MYLLAPLFGYYADKWGPSKLTLMSSALFCPGYLAAAYLYKIKANYQGFAVCFAMIGAATTVLYLSTVLPCARLYPKSAGLAISLPVTGFGVSSLWQSQVINWFFYDSQHNLDVYSVFVWYAGLYLVTGILSYMSSLLYNVDDIKEKSDVEDEDEGLELTQADRFKSFISNYETWVMLVSFICCSGALEMYLNNMGALIDTLPNSASQLVSSHVSMFAIFSTVARLSVGVSSDLLRPYISTAIVLSVILFFTAAHHFSIALGFYAQDDGALFSLASGINGLFYGSIFTLYPTVIATVWGLKSFGTNWAIFVCGPAIGSLVYGMLFASVYDRHRLPNQGQCIGNKCYELTFLITGAGILISCIAVFNLWHHVWKKNSSIKL